MILGFGFIAAGDLDNNVLKVLCQQTAVETIFGDVDDLIAAGWVVD